MNKKSNTKVRVPVALVLGSAAFALAAAALVSRGAVGVSAVESLKYYPGHNTLSEVIDAAGDLNEKLAEEGMVLLKNDGQLPLERGSWVSVFGGHASGLNHGWTGKADLPDAITTVPQSLEAAGFHVNPTLNKFYEKNGKSGGGGAMSSSSYFDVEPTNFGGIETASYRNYNDAAVIVLARIGGEGSDISTVVNSEKVTDYDAPHAALYTDEKGDSYHHALMLTKSEHELINHVKKYFSKICVVINSSNAMELGTLKDDPAINGLIWMGAPGETGAAALGRILVGDVNPSGRLVDEMPKDFTADPTWCNFGGQNQVGNTNHAFNEAGDVYHVNDVVLGLNSSDGTYTYTDYEEDIYLGYRYYETYYEDAFVKAAGNATKEKLASDWYDDHVAYAFGEGLSYTTFDFELDGLYTDAQLKKAVGATLSPSLLNSGVVDGVKQEAQVKKLYAPVKVTNVGNRAGKEVVQIYSKAPYTEGGIEKSVHDIVGFGKTKILQPGESQTVVVEFNVQDMASWDARDFNKDGVKGDYELDAGEYTIRATSSSHVDLSVPVDERHEYAEVSFELEGNAHLKLDDFSGGELHNLFTTEDGTYKGTGFDGRTIYNSVRTADMMYEEEDAMTLLSRADFDGTFPQKVVGRDIEVKKQVQKVDGEGKPVTEDGKPVYEEQTVTEHLAGLTFKKEITDMWEAFRTPRVDYHPAEKVDDARDGIRVYQELTDNPEDPWYISQEDFDKIAANWTQAAESNPNNEIRFKDLRGLSWDDPKYDLFLNQLTWKELVSLFCESRASTPAIDSVGKPKSVDEDGPNNYENLFEWVDEPTIAATFNQELAEQEGSIIGDMAILTQRTGWYGPGMDMHHTAFSGRNNEYYSQDGLQGGYIAAAVVRGAQSKGLNAMIKHLAFNDQDTNRGGQSNMVWTTEQNIRQYEIKMFQMAIQEGGAGAGMSGYGRICGIVNQSNYRLNHNLLQDEWGWKGFMITDGFLGMRWCTTLDIMIRCGYQIQYKTEGAGYDWVSGKWDPTYRNGKGGVAVPAKYAGDPSTWVDADGKPVSVQVEEWKESYHQYYYSRINAKSVIYSTVNSNNWQNGYAELQFNGADERGTINLANAKVGVSYEANIGLVVDKDSTVAYSLGNGAPEGLSINDKGVLSGKPSAEGTYRFSVEALIDGYVKKSVNCALTVESAFYFNEDGDDLTALNVGDEVFAKIESDVLTTKDGKYDSVTYSVKEGKLPAGLELKEDGTIEGTVTEAGDFHVVAKIEAKKTTSGGGGFPFGLAPKMGPGGPGGGSTTTTETLTFAFDIKVAGDPVIPGPTLEERVDALESALDALNDAIEALELAAVANAADLDALESALAALKTQVEELAKAGADTSALKATIASLEATIKTLEAKNADLAKQLEEAGKKSGGCGSSIVAGSFVLTAALASIAALIIKKKSKED